MKKVYVDGQHGTTGLQIRERLQKHNNVEFIDIEYEKRRDKSERERLLNEADIVFLCLPNEGSMESVSMIKNEKVRIIDASTAYRTDKNWVYGMPELDRGNQREKIKNARFVSNPGCHATGFILALQPLVKEGVIPANYPIACHSLSGYSGAGKQMIEEYEAMENELLKLPRHYALNLNHKHLAEMKMYTGLNREPLFNPIICNYYKGLAVTIPLYTDMFNKYKSAEEVHKFLSDYYAGENFVKVIPFASEEGLDKGFFNLSAQNDTNNADIFVFGDKEKVSLMTRIDNLGKGASGAAVQNMNIMLGLDETIGLV